MYFAIYCYTHKFFFFLIKNAEKGGYAVGAFNVYNLEGVEAVISAAEAENSPAILQVQNADFKNGKKEYLKYKH